MRDGSHDDPVQLEQQLAELAKIITNENNEEAWRRVETSSHRLANALRTRNDKEDIHTMLGKTLLPSSLAVLLNNALNGRPTPDMGHAPVTSELLRVAANLCIEHDENRGRLLEAQIPQSVLSLLEGYLQTGQLSPITKQLSLGITDLKTVRNAIGVLLNASLGFDPVRELLCSRGTMSTVLKLSSSMYPTANWMYNPSDEHDNEESWHIRTVIAFWSWSLIDNLRDIENENVKILNPDILPLLTPTLTKFCPPYPADSRAHEYESSLLQTLVEADFNNLERTCTFIESLALDSEEVRLSLGSSFSSEGNEMPTLSVLLNFLENGTYPPGWAHTSMAEADKSRLEKDFDMCKGALIKVVVDISGEDSNREVLWDDSDKEKPGGPFVEKMTSWLKAYFQDMTFDAQTPPSTHRDDLVICASLSLGNLAHDERRSSTLLSSPHSLSPILLSPHFYAPTTDMKVKHGILGLLKHVTQSCFASPIIYDTLCTFPVVQRICESGIWDEKVDAIGDVVQLNAVAIVKHMCSIDVDQVYACLFPFTEEGLTGTSGLSQVLGLVSRAESVRVSSEGTRVLVQVIKTLWSPDPPKRQPQSRDPSLEKDSNDKRERAMNSVLNMQCALALANLVAGSARYPVLVNEGIVALSLLSLHETGGPLVAKALTTARAVKAEPHSESLSPTPTSEESSVFDTASRGNAQSSSAPVNALDMVVRVLRNVDNPVEFPVEVRINACTFLSQLTKNNTTNGLMAVKKAVFPALEQITGTNTLTLEKEEMLVKAAKRALKSFSCEV